MIRLAGAFVLSLMDFTTSATTITDVDSEIRMTALVTGGTGYVGEAIARALRARGDSVRVLARPTSRTDHLIWRYPATGPRMCRHVTASATRV